jgi:hypothetical protein
METSDFTTAISVTQSPRQAFDAISNPRAWWSEEIEGNTDTLHSVFNYHFEDLHRARIKIAELIPNEKIVWHVVENYFKFTEDKTEWTDTKIVFDISEKDNKTHIRMTHVGLVPEFECFEICQDSWTSYIHNSLRGLITTGKGKPNAKGRPTTENERKLAAK